MRERLDVLQEESAPAWVRDAVDVVVAAALLLAIALVVMLDG